MSFYRVIIAIYRNNYSDIVTYCSVLLNYYCDITTYYCDISNYYSDISTYYCQFESTLVTNPEDRFSRDEAHIVSD